jgi:hypothetical protein
LSDDSSDSDAQPIKKKQRKLPLMPIGGADFTNKTHVKWLANVVFKRHNNIRVRYPYWSSWLTKNNIPSGIQIQILWYVQDIEFSEIYCEFFTDLYPSDYSPTFKKLVLYKFKQYQWRNYPLGCETILLFFADTVYPWPYYVPFKNFQNKCMCLNATETLEEIFERGWWNTRSCVTSTNWKTPSIGSTKRSWKLWLGGYYVISTVLTCDCL